MVPRYSNLSSIERYTYYSTKYKTRMPIRFYPHYTKVEIPTTVPYIKNVLSKEIVVKKTK